MIAVLMKPKEKITQKEDFKNIVKPDIIVERTYVAEEVFDEEGNKITKYKKQKINLTKKINETKKLLNQATAEEKIAELEKIFAK